MQSRLDKTFPFMIGLKFEKLIVISFIIIAILLGLDLYYDLSHGSDLEHLGIESAAFLISSIMIGANLKRLIHENLTEKLILTEALKRLNTDRDQWRAKSEQYLKGLGQAIEDQFTNWKLSDSEKDIGLLILKGFSHKEISIFRGTSERTVRQQAASLYAKAGLENKNQLCAFFLEDLALIIDNPST